ncbi:leucine-rich repeat protein [Ruminococcus champanellensis]|uniref:leucine-rich repeat protein n=1 Tax=Ruminococcus champanellensis TaxID=1161942 RepID=UPI00248CA70A|nr:leucine-rich repeat protein [Ruminococcus champanellensis]
MIKQTARRMISWLTALVLIISYTAMFPLPVVMAEGTRKDNEKLYASVLNNYVENVFPGKVDVFDDTQEWKYSDVWNAAFGPFDPGDYGYKFYDLDGDGIDELFIIGLKGSYMDKVHVREIYTMYNGSVKPIAIGGARWNYYVLEGKNTLCEEGAHSASEMGYTFYHLKDGELIAFEEYINNAGTWYYADGENCEESYYNSMQVISKDEVYSAHSNTMGGEVNPIFDQDTHNFAEYYTPRCGNDAYWEMDESTGILTVSGTGPMYDYNRACPIFAYTAGSDPPYSTQHFTSIMIQRGITSVGNNAFFGSYGQVKAIYLPNGLESIGSQAFFFHADDVPASVIVPKTVTYIGEKALGYHGYNTSDENNDSIYVEETFPGFTLYGYSGTVAETYAKENGLKFVALDEEEQEQIDLDFVTHHVGIAKLGNSRSIWSLSDDVDTLTELMEFEYFGGNAGLSFVTKAYGNLGNPKEIIEAGRLSRNIDSTVSDTMYYQALFYVLYQYDDYDLLEKAKESYTNVLHELSQIIEVADKTSDYTSKTAAISKTIEKIAQADTFAKLGTVIENFQDQLDITQLPIQDWNGNSLSIGAGDVLSLISSVMEINEKNQKNQVEVLHSVVFFMLFRDLQDNYREILTRMCETAPEDNTAYKTALQNVRECLTMPNIETFILKYIVGKAWTQIQDTLNSVGSVVLGEAAVKLLEKVPGGVTLKILNEGGKLVDKWFTEMTASEKMIASIGEMVCYYHIVQSLEIVGQQYEKELLEAQNMKFAKKYHDTVSLYYRACNNYCKYGNTFLALFLSSHYSVDISSGEIKDKNNLVFKYVITTWENSLTDEYLNQTFGLSNGDYYSWYKKILTLNASIKELRHYYDQPICCTQATDEEFTQLLGEMMAPAMDKAKNYIEDRISDWRTVFIGCPVRTDVLNESGETIVSIQDGDIIVQDWDAFMNMFCYTLEECKGSTEAGSYGTMLLIPAECTYIVTAQEDCEVFIQETKSKDLSDVMLTNNVWEINRKALKQGEVFEANPNGVFTESKDKCPWVWVGIIGIVLILVGAAAVYRKRT